MSQSTSAISHQRSPRSAERSPELIELLAHCPEHLFSTDDDEMTPLAHVETDTDSDRETRLENAA
jgi:hypothetical protein